MKTLLLLATLLLGLLPLTVLAGTAQDASAHLGGESIRAYSDVEPLLSAASCNDENSTTSSRPPPTDESEENDEDGNDGDEKEKVAPHVSEVVAPGELSLLKWADDGSVIHRFAAQLGLPSTLVPTIQTFASQLGIYDIVRDFIYKRPCKPKGGRFYPMANPFAEQVRLPDDGTTFPQNTNNNITQQLMWYAQRPGSEWQSDMHWLGPSDERTHETVVRMLFEGGIGPVLDAIGRQYDLDGLMIQGVGFLAVSHCEVGFLHHDFNNVEGKVFNLLIPLYSPPGAGPELKLVGKRFNERTQVEEDVTTNIKYDANYGVLVGDGTWHATRECDHRPFKDVRIVVSVYLADVTESNLERLSYDDTAIFPVPEMEDWLWAQRGRHWEKEKCMMNDIGRTAFKAVDTSTKCPKLAAEGKCESKPMTTRWKCPRSCRIFMDDWEYQPGIERSKVLGDICIEV